MKVSEIIKQVRWCIDKETLGDNFVERDDVYLDNIIKAHIGDALYWCAYYASNTLLNGSGNQATDLGIIMQYDDVKTSGLTYTKVEKDGVSYGVITMPDEFVRLVRVRASEWHKAVTEKTVLSEDSEEYAMLRNEISKATNDKPRAAIVNSDPKKMEIYPYSDNVSLTISVIPEDKTSKSGTEDRDVNVPSKIRTAFIYYIAFLVLAAYGDNGANIMLSIAKMNAGINA